MATKKNDLSPLTQALLKTAEDMRRVGIMDEATHRKIKPRHLDAARSHPVDAAQG